MTQEQVEKTGHIQPTDSMRNTLNVLLFLAVVIVVGVLIWQGITAGGSPDPTVPNTSRMVAILDIGVLVFREGLECILVLMAITASMTGERQYQRRPVGVGAAVAFVATIITWFIATTFIHDLMQSIPALDLQAATGLLAVVVLMVVMNWYFHKIYWRGWITLHNRKKKQLLKSAGETEISKARLYWGLGLLGFASLYREGFEVVLFLQSYYLKMGGWVILWGAFLGLFFTGIVAVLTFVLHSRLPYRKMLILTGILLGVVFLVMVGEQAQEMQLAHWIPTTSLGGIFTSIPPWMGLWFSIFPTRETLVAQLFASIVVLGSYFLAKHKTLLENGSVQNPL